MPSHGLDADGVGRSHVGGVGLGEAAAPEQATAIGNGRPPGTLAPRVIALVLVMAATAAIFAQTRHVALLGWDTYPLILASRIESLADLGRSFGSRLMGDELESTYYRPLLNASLSVDYAINGLAPFGYQLTNALIFGACALALFAAYRRMSPGSAGALAALIAFLLHPVHFEVVPVVSRRSELLCLLFLLGAVAGQANASRRRAGQPAWWPALWGLLAMASKETGFLSVPLIALVSISAATSESLAERIGRAAREIWPGVLLATVFAGVRFAVLGGIVGRSVDFGSAAALVYPAGLRVLRGVILARSDLLSPLAAVLPPLGAIGCAAVCLGLKSLRVAGERAATMRVVGVGALLLLLTTSAYAAAGLVQPWYLEIPAAGFALIFGAAVEALVFAWRSEHAGGRLLAVVGLSSGLALVWIWAPLSPLFHRYTEWENGTLAAQHYLSKLSRVIEAAPQGKVIVHPGPRLWARGSDEGPRVIGSMLLHSYSVGAWARLAYPDDRIRIEWKDLDSLTAASDEVVIALRYSSRR